MIRQYAMKGILILFIITFVILFQDMPIELKFDDIEIQIYFSDFS